ncbi:MAG: YbaB/EbfC family nucleoid-associated protein [Acidobacteriota bacterium]
MNMRKLIKQAQDMREKMERDLSETVTEATVGGGLVTVKIDGHKHLLGVKIEAEAMDPDDPAMLEDLIVAAFSVASNKMDEMLREKVGSLTGGAIPGLF